MTEPEHRSIALIGGITKLINLLTFIATKIVCRGFMNRLLSSYFFSTRSNKTPDYKVVQAKTTARLKLHDDASIR